MTIGTAEDWIVTTSRDELECHFAAGSIDVASAPYEWSGAFLKKLATTLPAVRVVFEGGAAQASTELTLDTVWTVYVMVGWAGEGQAERRRGERGAYAIVEILAPRLHNSLIPDVARVAVDTIDNVTEAEWERVRIAVYAIGLELTIPLDYVQPPAKPLDDFLRAGIEYDIPSGEDVDASDLVTLPQT